MVESGSLVGEDAGDLEDAVVSVMAGDGSQMIEPTAQAGGIKKGGGALNSPPPKEPLVIYCKVKLQTLSEPAPPLDVLSTNTPQWSRLVTVFCSVRKP